MSCVARIECAENARAGRLEAVLWCEEHGLVETTDEFNSLAGFEAIREWAGKRWQRHLKPEVVVDFQI